MKPFKNLLRGLSRNEAMRTVACHALRGIIRLVHATGRWTFVGEQHIAPYWRDDKPVIVCFWHGRLMMLPFAWRGKAGFTMLQSPHPDGKLMSCIINGLGIRTIWGSKNKGGSDALRKMVAVLKDGGAIGMTPDGPRGPRMRVSEGAIALARLSGAPIVPLAFGCTRRKILRTWDRLALALPFARGVFVYGAPIAIARDASPPEQEAARLRLEAALNAVTDEADHLTGQPLVDPAPVEPTYPGLIEARP
jgi:lysophospholipid acyltransferase (LPLAT)-like uncharacterized protein